MSEFLSNGVLLIGLYLLLMGIADIRRRYQRNRATDEVSLYCPNREEKAPITSESLEIVWKEQVNECYGYKCEECGNIHTWVYGPPSPIYVGDKFRFTFNGP